MMRILEPFEDHFWEFYNAQSDPVKTKIDYVLHLVMSVERIPKKFFKHIEDGIYEIRIKVGSDIYRVFCFFDEGKLVILLHGFTKKTQKLPRKQIEKAKQLRGAYYEHKES
ncbi:MAG: type II toxin-antitoxin system RelE/ParE family toxin [Balneola sp.]|nr:MAG: type II toxin-antitoxin system RelE/ParE family toxin [Balneola sp.]